MLHCGCQPLREFFLSDIVVEILEKIITELGNFMRKGSCATWANTQPALSEAIEKATKMQIESAMRCRTGDFFGAKRPSHGS